MGNAPRLLEINGALSSHLQHFNYSIAQVFEAFKDYQDSSVTGSDRVRAFRVLLNMPFSDF